MTTSFDEFIKTNTLPVFVDFWADWCGPCHAIAPSVKRLSQEYKGKLTVIKVNIDERPQIAANLGIQSIPTLMIFKNGTQVWRGAGSMPYEQLKAQVEKHL